jgi:hypothetical protein
VAQGGFLPLPWSEIQAWSGLYSIRLRPWELDVITAIDDVWLGVMGRQTVTLDDLTAGDEEATDA